MLAVSWKGEVTWAPLAGVVTVIAYPGTTPAINNDKEQRSRFIDPPKVKYSFDNVKFRRWIQPDGPWSHLIYIGISKGELLRE